MMEINQINNAIQRPVVGDAPPITLESLVKGRWAQYISERELKPSTVYSYDSVLRTHILPELGAQELTEITPQQLSDFRDKLSESLSSKTYRNIYWLLTQLFAVAKDFDLIEKSPVRPSLSTATNLKEGEAETFVGRNLEVAAGDSNRASFDLCAGCCNSGEGRRATWTTLAKLPA